jgi:hypothetical protein
MNTLLRPLPNVWNPRALALVVLALHGAVAFTQYNERGWQLGLIGIML